jgi:hypothetical protein
MPDDAITCEGCGTLMKRKPQPEQGVRGIRQGRSGSSAQPLPGSSRTEPKDEHANRDMARDVPKMYRDDRRPERRRGVERFTEDAGRPQSRRGIPRVSESQVRKLRIRQEKVHPVKKHMVNWMHILTLAIILFILGIAGGFLYLTKTPAGQVVLARMGQDAPAQAYWQIGEQYMNQGQVSEAIEAFKKADEKNPDNVDGLLSLGSALEAAGRTEEAQALYKRLYEDVSPERPEAYRNQIRMLIAADRTPEAAELMKLAYEKTGLPSFNQQRDATLPKLPETDLPAGRYTEEKQVNLISPQDYDILYMLGDGEFAKDAKPYTGPILLKDGQSNRLRAVCVSGDLYSDPLDVTYSVVLPSPDAPRSSLAPNTYEKQQRVWLRYPGKEADITIYYTLDGSTPDLNSPRYTGDPIYLPGGRVTLKAIAVNSFGKTSNVMEVGYKIKNVKFREMYSEADAFQGFKLLSTTQSAFIQANGEPTSQETMTISDIEGECKKLNYSWGYCIVAPINGQPLVVEVYETQDKFAAPRGTHIGNAEKEVTDNFRDMLQLNSQNGDRSLYYDGNNTGIIKLTSEDHKSIQYACYTLESNRIVLQYDLTNGVVTAISHKFMP